MRSASAIIARMELSAPTDEALMSRFAQGDSAAFEQLYERHELPVWRFIFRSCRNRATADDLMQEVWFAVAREAHRYRTGARFTTWLYTIARNRVIDSHRTARHHASLDEAVDDDGAPLIEQLADPAARSPLQDLERAQIDRAILQAVDQLPPEQREAFLLQAEVGLSVEEIAEVAATNFETTKSRLRYARTKLRQLLQDYA
jgi:RNA polymerase sigma factor (sigma-70 family)